MGSSWVKVVISLNRAASSRQSACRQDTAEGNKYNASLLELRYSRAKLEAFYTLEAVRSCPRCKTAVFKPCQSSIFSCTTRPVLFTATWGFLTSGDAVLLLWALCSPVMDLRSASAQRCLTRSCRCRSGVFVLPAELRRRRQVTKNTSV